MRVKDAIAVPLVSAILAIGCKAAVGVRGVKVPADARERCAEHCETIGLTLSAVAIMANNVGCICQPERAAAMSEYSAATTAGVATILLQEQQRQQQQQTAAD